LISMQNGGVSNLVLVGFIFSILMFGAIIGITWV
jgi:hypothetical protein